MLPRDQVDQVRDGEGNAEADDEPGDREPQSFLHDEPDHVASRGAERKTNAEFVRALRDAVSDDGIDSHSGQSERQSRETAQQIHRELSIGRGG